MNRIIKLFVATICAAFAFVGCEQAENSGVAPTIKLIEGTVTETSISFVMGVDEAKECAYMLYDGDVTSVEEIFSKGTVVDGNGGLYTIDNLTRNTTYYIIAAARNATGGVMSNTLVVTTKGSGGGNGGNDDNDDDFELPEIEGVENVNIVKSQDGRWYKPYNYYVTFVCDNDDRIILDFYTLDETMSQYFPYGQYSFASDYSPYTIDPETSGFVPAGKSADGEGYNFTDGYVSVDVVNGYYAIYMMLTYVVDGESKSIQGYYNGILSGASVPEGDNEGAKKLIEVLDVGSTSFQFRINAEEGEYWRCSVVDKRTYDQAQSNPGAWVVTYGFMLEGPLTFNWENGKICEYVPGLEMRVTSSTDYLIIAALMDYSEGSETSLLGGVEIVQIRTNAEAEGTGSVDMTIKEVGVNEITLDCIFGDNVWCCYVAMMETSNLQEIKDGKYAMAGYDSYEECMLSLVPGLSHDFMRQFLESQYDYKWDGLKYGTSYTPCIKVVDMNNGATFIELEPFTTK
ncbi:MAG: hypothetical protein J6V59_02870 [Alistipes sp.]|nr:hypothetical protein [Alistipes sp.]